MRTRFLPIFFGVVFALTFFAVAAGAQVQLQEVQQQQVPDNQQQILEVQQQAPNDQQQAVEVRQQQVLDNQGQAVAVQQQQVRVQAEGCKRPSGPVLDINDATNDQLTRFFNIDSEVFQIEYDVDSDGGTPVFELEVRDEVNDRVEETIFVVGEEHDTENIVAGPGEFRLKILEENAEYDITVRECRGNEPDDDNDTNNNNDNDTNEGNTNNDTNNDGTDTTDTTDTTTDTTDTTTTDTTGDALETTTANNPDSVGDADAFRCDFFLRAVRDDRGALRDQYVGDELIVQRFEQCLSEDVLADTIPDRKLPFTGGMPLLGLAAIGLVSLAVVATVLVAPTRRRR